MSENAKGGHSTFPSNDTISANRGGSDGLDLRAAGGSACEAWQGNLWDDGARGVFCHPAGVSCLGRVGSGGGAGLANGYFLPARWAESLACLTRQGNETRPRFVLLGALASVLRSSRTGNDMIRKDSQNALVLSN